MKKQSLEIHKKGGMREIIVIALPMLVSQACDTIMIFTDRLFLARLGSEYMNAAMGGGLTAFMTMSFFLGFIGYATALVAQYLGAQRKKNCAKVLTQAIIISFIAYPLVLTLCPFAHYLFKIMGVSKEQLGPQKIYFNILIFGTIISLLRTSLSGFFSGIGRTSIVMIASFASMLVNVIANYILIYGKLGSPAMGIKGAAYGTILGGFIGLVILGIKYFSKENRREFQIKESLALDKNIIKKFFQFGTPPGLELFLNVLAFNIMVLIFHSQGLIPATAATIVFNWDLVSFVPLIGVEIAVTSLVGRFMGSRDPDSAHRATMSGLKLGMIYSSIVFIFFLAFPQYLVQIFKPQVTDNIFLSATPLALFMVRMAALYVFVEAILLVFMGALRGAGDTWWAMAISVTLHWLMLAVLAIIILLLQLPVKVGWVAMVVMFFFFSTVVFLRYHSGKWKRIRVVSSELGEDKLIHPDALPETSEL